MKNSQKILPHLNQIYLRQQSYEFHKKRIRQIKDSHPKLSLLTEPSIHYPIKSSLITKKQKFGNNYSLVKKLSANHDKIMESEENIGLCLKRWRSPFEKRKQLQIYRQNHRLRNRIKTSISNLSSRKLSNQYSKFAQIKKRICKYEVQPRRHKAVLKCKKTLNYISHSNVKISKDSIMNESMSEKPKKETRFHNLSTEKMFLNKNRKRDIYNKSDNLKNKIKHRYGEKRAVTTFASQEEIKEETEENQNKPYFPTELSPI